MVDKNASRKSRNRSRATVAGFGSVVRFAIAVASVALVATTAFAGSCEYDVTFDGGDEWSGAFVESSGNKCGQTTICDGAGHCRSTGYKYRRFYGGAFPHPQQKKLTIFED